LYANSGAARGGESSGSAENSTGFHAPQESARILGESIDGQIALRDGRRQTSVVPPLGTLDTVMRR
jgi:hypothetical protein